MAKSTKPKRPRDANQLAHQLVEQSTAKSEETPITSASLSSYMSSIGRKGGKIGGKRRLETMSVEQRRRAAKKAAQARWGRKK